MTFNTHTHLLFAERIRSLLRHIRSGQRPTQLVGRGLTHTVDPVPSSRDGRGCQWRSSSVVLGKDKICALPVDSSGSVRAEPQSTGKLLGLGRRPTNTGGISSPNNGRLCSLHLLLWALFHFHSFLFFFCLLSGTLTLFVTCPCSPC